MKKIFLTALICMFSTAVFAASVTGTVSDSETGQPVAGLVVGLEELSVVAETDSSGRFSFLNIDRGDYTLHFSNEKYGHTTRKIRVLRDFTSDFVIKEMKFDSSGEVPKGEMSLYENNQKITRDDIKGYPLRGVGDSLHLMQTLPGVGAPFSLATVPVIRNTNTLYNKYYVDDIPIDYPYHYLGGFIPVMSSINEQIIDNAELVKGNAPMWAGDNVGNIIRVKTREADQPGLTNRILLDPFAPVMPTYSCTYAEKDFSLVGSARRSMVDVFADMDYTDFSFTDFYVKTVYNYKENHRLTFIANASADQFKKGDFEAASGYNLLALNWDYLLNRNLLFKTTFSYYEMLQSVENKSKTKSSGEVGASIKFDPTQFRLFQSVSYAKKNLDFNAGYEFIKHNNGARSNITMDRLATTDAMDTTTSSPKKSYKIEGYTIAGFADVGGKYGIVSADLGGRVERYGPTGKTSWDYKLEPGIDVARDVNIYLEASRYNAHPDMYYFITTDKPSRLKDCTAQNYGLGGKTIFSKNLFFQTELYYTEFRNMNPNTASLITMNKDEFKKLAQIQPFSQEMKGNNKGIEFFLKGNVKEYYGWSSLSISQTSRDIKKTALATSKDVESDFSQDFIYRFLVGSRWGKWNPSLLLNLYDTMPYTPSGGKTNSKDFGVQSRLDGKLNYFLDANTRIYTEVWNILFFTGPKYVAQKTGGSKKYSDVPIFAWAGMEMSF